MKSDSTDRRVHAENRSEAIVRYDRAGKWYVEYGQLHPRERVTARIAATRAWQLATGGGGVVHFDLPGGTTFDRLVRAYLGDSSGIKRRLMNNVSKTDACWLWTGAVGGKYGRVKSNGRVEQAHRLVYETLVEPISEGLEIDHLCGVPLCVNPDHLEVVTHGENVRRSNHYGRNKTHCPQGHPYDEVNTHVRPNGGRTCRVCDRDRYHERRNRDIAVV